MGIIRNTTPSVRNLLGYQLPPRVDVQVPDEVIGKYKAMGPGHRRLFDSGMLAEKTGVGRVARMESALVNEKAPEVKEVKHDEPNRTKKKGKKGKK